MWTFFVLISFENDILYSLDIDVFLYKMNLCGTKVLSFLNYGDVGPRAQKSKSCGFFS